LRFICRHGNDVAIIDHLLREAYRLEALNSPSSEPSPSQEARVLDFRPHSKK
jgi:hypothetical protein